MKQELYQSYFKNKKVTVMGLGLLGRGIGDAKFLAKSDCGLVVTDKKSEDDLKASTDELKNFKNITYKLGGHDKVDFENRDFILKAAGVPLDSEYIKHAKENGIQVLMSAALLVKIVKEKLPNTKVIGVTGTRGKSTTTELIAHILKSSGNKVHLAGNIRGVANLPVLEVIDDGDYLILELDSWQLQGFGDLKVSPDIAVFTNFMDDHMNYYKDDKDLYLKDKANIFVNQKESCVVCLSEMKDFLEGKGYKFSAQLPELQKFESYLIGKHNQDLISLAYEVAIICGLKDEEIKRNIKSFKGVPGRLEYLGEIDGVNVYNDNNATTGDAVMAGIFAVEESYNKKPIVILGGADKGLPLTDLENTLRENTKDVVLLSSTGTDRLNANKKYEFEKLEDCVSKAFEIAEVGDIILFSPGFASFSKYFRNEYDRNDLFVKLIKNHDSKI